MKKRIKNKFRPAHLSLLVLAVCFLFIYEALNAKSMKYDFDFVGYGGTFKYTNLSLFGISAYWITMFIGLAICIVISLKKGKENGFRTVTAAVIPIVFLIISLVGAKILYAVENLSTIKVNGLSFDGLSLFGAIFIFPLIAWLVSGFRKKKFAKWLDYCTVFELTLLVCVRIGCFINGCCGANIIFHNSIPIVLPVQLFEVFFDLWILELCLKVRESKGPDGRMYPVFMMSYSVVRFFLEFLRKTPKEIWIFSNGQIFAVICFVTGLLLYKYFKKHSVSKAKT